MSINSNSTNIQLDTKRHSFAHLMTCAVEIYFKQENNINQKLNKFLKESLLTKRAIFVDCLIKNDKGQVFAQRRTSDRRKFPSCWDLPGGGLETGESIWDCTKRELMEELGFELTKIIDILHWEDLELPESMRKESENHEQRVIQLLVEVTDYANPVLEIGKADKYNWFDNSNLDALMEGRDGETIEDKYTMNTVQKALEYKPKTVEFGVGPVIENGCYYDFILPRNLVPEDLKGISKVINDLMKKDLIFKKKEYSVDDAIKLFAEKNQPLKVELLENLRDRGTTSLSDEEVKDLLEENQKLKIIPLKQVYDDYAIKNDFEINKENPNLFDLIAVCDNSGGLGVVGVIKNTKGQFGLEVYNGTNKKGYLPLLSNQSVKNNMYQFSDSYLQLNQAISADFDGQDTYISIIGGTTNDLMWYSKEEYLEIIKEQYKNFIQNISFEEFVDIVDKLELKSKHRLRYDELSNYRNVKISAFKEQVDFLVCMDDILYEDVCLKQLPIYDCLDKLLLTELEDKGTRLNFSTISAIEKASTNILTKSLSNFLIHNLSWDKENDLTYSQVLSNDIFNQDLFLYSHAKLAPKITTYSIIDQKTGTVLFEDLCKGPHIESLEEVKSCGFQLDKFSASYWRGDQERGINMQRLYAVVFDTPEELEVYNKQIEEAKRRDHRILGEQLELFSFSEIVGKGLPLWLEKGATIKRLLERFIVEEEIRRGYKHVETPDMARLALYEKSGHYPYYKDSMYAPIEIDGDSFMLRPMTCPHHFQIYSMKPRSYRELPMRIAELAKLYRYEDSGALSGLTRVRCFCLADSHIVCTPVQAKNEASLALDLIEYCAEVFGLTKNKDYRYELSLGDRNEEKKYYKDDAAWDFAENVLREVLTERGENFVELSGEAAFYGPKIDIQMRNINGKESTAFTVQYDFVMPKRFNLQYIDADQNSKEAVVIHRSSIGALERVFAFLTEFYAGKFPFWLAPEQIRILTINDQVLPFVDKVKEILNETVLMKPLKYNEIRYSVDSRSESLGKKIREAKLDKIPMLMVIGQKDVDANEVSIEYKDDSLKVSLSELKEWLGSVK